MNLETDGRSAAILVEDLKFKAQDLKAMVIRLECALNGSNMAKATINTNAPMPTDGSFKNGIRQEIEATEKLVYAALEVAARLVDDYEKSLEPTCKQDF